MSSETYDFMAFKRPVKSLATYYLVSSLMTGPLFPIFWFARMCKYWTLEYDFDEDGISMKWGVLWRRDIHLTYRRIQDIHLTRNVIQRWMRLADVSVQTAGGSASPEMVIEGAPCPEELRDDLYARMRGSGLVDHAAATSGPDSGSASGSAEAIELLTEIRDLIRERGR